MKVKQLIWESGSWKDYGKSDNIDPQLVLYFGATRTMELPEVYQQLETRFPHSHIVGCSTAGEIIGDEVHDNTAVATAIDFEKTTIQVSYEHIDHADQSYEVGRNVAKNIPSNGLKSIFVLSDGLLVNGSELIRGISDQVPKNVLITGGLSGDGASFEKTLVACNGYARAGQVAVVGFYGDHIQVGQSSVGGWDSFGPDRLVTKSKSNVLYELDGKPALDLYKKYLGDKARELPLSALLFPLMIRPEAGGEEGIVRTILSVSEDDQSMTFAGDVPEGFHVKLMMSSLDSLIDGACEASKISKQQEDFDPEGDKLAILISCVGRKLVLGPRVEEEVEAVQINMDEHTKQIGFYSYGEISSHVKTKVCELHNQTMTITLIAEK